MVEQVQHKFNANPRSMLCLTCGMIKEAKIHTPKAQIIQGTITPKKIG